tara:strand:- start:8 stop:637 length:630 start_codon:yes stop_codon:yes gene_type:complete
MNWEDILKVQITTSRQKLRTDKEPLPEDDDEECFPIVQKIFREILKHAITFQGNTYATNYNKSAAIEAFSRNLYDEDVWCKILGGFSNYEHTDLVILDRPEKDTLSVLSKFEVKGVLEDGLGVIISVYRGKTSFGKNCQVEIKVKTCYDLDNKFHVLLRFALPDLTIGVMEELEFLHEAIKNTIESNAKVSFPTSPEFMNKIREYTRGI